MWKRGRPAKYHSGLPEDLVRLMSLGYTNVWVCNDWNISEKTLYTWLNEKAELREAYEIGLPKCQVWWEKFGKEMMEGMKDAKGFSAWIAFMNRKFNYRGADTTAAQPQIGNTINIGNMNVLSTDSKEIDIKLAQLLDKYGAVNIDDLKGTLLEYNNE